MLLNLFALDKRTLQKECARKASVYALTRSLRLCGFALVRSYHLYERGMPIHQPQRGVVLEL